ncbi:hypothetical protein BpHYR1_022229, partial [Brachionus plicatilis]
CILENNFNDTVEDAEPLTKNKRSTGRIFDFLHDCESLDEFKRLIKDLRFDNIAWHFHLTNRLAYCDKHIYNCKHRRKGCKKAIFFQVKAGQTRGTVHVSDNEHSNHPEEEDFVTIPIAVKEKIKYLRQLGQTKRSIKKNLIKEGIQPPTDNQIQYIINSVSIDNNKNCRMNELKEWCELHSTIPENDDDKVFVGKFEYVSDCESDFSPTQHENFPIITGGTTDRNKSLHPVGVAVTRNETDEDYGFFFSSVKETYEKCYEKNLNLTILIADNAPAITNGFQKVFELKQRVNCWAHVYRNIESHLRPVNKVEAARILEDVKQIQKIFDPQLFATSVKLFREKWNRVNSASFQTFSILMVCI